MKNGYLIGKKLENSECGCRVKKCYHTFTKAPSIWYLHFFNKTNMEESVYSPSDMNDLDRDCSELQYESASFEEEENTLPSEAFELLLKCYRFSNNKKEDESQRTLLMVKTLLDLLKVRHKSASIPATGTRHGRYHSRKLWAYPPG